MASRMLKDSSDHLAYLDQTVIAKENKGTKAYQIMEKGVLQAEIDRFLQVELQDDGYTGMELRETPSKVEVVIKAGAPRSVLGEGGKRIRGLALMIQKRFGFPPETVECFVERPQNRGLSPVAMAESLKYKLNARPGQPQMSVRRAAYSVLRNVMESGAEGCEIIVSGKLKAQRAKSVKFKQGFMIKSGETSRRFVQCAVRHLCLRSGVLGIKIRILDPTFVDKTKKPMPFPPDKITIFPTWGKEDKEAPQ
eukprot:gnl/MRDRNA2_/MRDRNA2_20585_c0_seq1.p1 gnl/MRDRNA2_/MRDRNA2_20585_c0~~gnl/MRDRNA2_/MRDRNA2_20585_c0_seq1.p1  ORF type:complete len:251 (-),score=30.28 gnl/MRDRNA2_/MRDRNA2_20585_c0_seq1:19-771(-)